VSGGVRRSRMPRTTTVVTLAQLSFGGGGDEFLAAAARVIADGARASAGWSRQIPPSIGVSAGDDVAIVAAGAPNARPAEYGLAHPLFGDRRYWYPASGELQPFLSPAAVACGDAAMAKYFGKVDVLAARAGFR